MTKLPCLLDTPIYAKLSPQEPWPSDPVFHLITQDGLFLCRNHEFFSSCTPARRFPCELEPHRPFLNLSYPKIPRRQFELAVGFCARIYQRQGSEAGLLIIWNKKTRRMRLLCPPQVATVGHDHLGNYPIGLHYEISDMADEEVLLGDLHSHGDGASYASVVDQQDEQMRAGTLHVVIGRCHDVLAGRPPDVHIEIVVDGMRFRVKDELVIEGYRKPRMNVPQDWIDRVKLKSWNNKHYDPATAEIAPGLTLSEPRWPTPYYTPPTPHSKNGSP